MQWSAGMERTKLRLNATSYATRQAAQAFKLRRTTEGSGHGQAGASDNVPIMCRGNRCDGAWARGLIRVSRKASSWPRRSLAQAAAQRLSDQDIMPRYRMTPPARGRCPAPQNAERRNVR